MKDDPIPQRKVKDDPPFLVKVCGITNAEDARICADCGVSGLGFNFFPESSRFVTPEAAAHVIAGLPSGILVYGVVVLGRDGSELWSEIGDLLDGIQVHGAQSEEDLRRFGDRRLLVAVSPVEAGRFSHFPLIIDTSWGTGQLACWEEVARLDRPFVLSGGLRPENVGEAIQKLQPIGVDVCSGVERSPGRKDPDRVARFMEVVRGTGRLSDEPSGGGAAR